mmetsp:Transcript_23981/g.51302  ORF Transcript_23981/g.51302 Transcript_23981/m.51302 type:complete len:283 (-) Transcript_23981:119-967(-)
MKGAMYSHPPLDSESIAQSLAAVLLQLHPRGHVILEEGVLVLGVQLHVLLERRLQQRQVAVEHDGVAGGVLPHGTALHGLPALPQQVLEVGVVEFAIVLAPAPDQSRPVPVAAPHRVRPRERRDVLVGEALGMEDRPKVIDSLGAREASVLGLHAVSSRCGVLPSVAGGDVRATHGLGGNIRGERPEVGVADLVRDVLVGDGLEEGDGHGGEAGVGAECSLACVGESHGRVGTSSRQFSRGVDSRIVPTQADQDRSALLLLDEGLDVGNDGCFCHGWSRVWG